jgi:CRISPR-associated protein Cmr2
VQVDLVLLSLGGVQRFIGESRSTADVAGASKIVQDLACLAAHAVQRRLAGSHAPCGLIFPVAPDAPSVTNKIAFLAPEGTGPGIARATVEDISRSWRDRLEETFKTGQPPPTPGTPDLAWVSVTGPATGCDYGGLWEAAQREMAGRRRARVFEPVEIPQKKLSAQSPGLPAVTAPRGSLPHERNEALSAAGWMKRRAGSERFPSTVSIVSSVFRSRLLERAGSDPDVAAELRSPVRALTTALNQLTVHSDRSTLRSVPTPAGLEPLAGRLGAWMTPERWNDEGIAREYGTPPNKQIVGDGRRAAGALAAVARKAGIPPPSAYFAVVVQDLDHLGRALGHLDLDQQRTVSRQHQRARHAARRTPEDAAPTGGSRLRRWRRPARLLPCLRSPPARRVHPPAHPNRHHDRPARHRRRGRSRDHRVDRCGVRAHVQPTAGCAAERPERDRGRQGCDERQRTLTECARGGGAQARG